MHLRFPSRLRPIVAVVAIWMLACGCGPGAADAGSDAQGDAAPIDEGAAPPGEGAPPTTAGTAVGGAEARGEDDGLGGQQVPADVDGCYFTSIR